MASSHWLFTRSPIHALLLLAFYYCLKTNNVAKIQSFMLSLELLIIKPRPTQRRNQEDIMGVDGWSLTAKPCDSCKTAAATVFCRADSFFLCTTCDAKVHAPNKLSSRHARVWVCEVCEQAPATVTCKADAAALCSACDVDVHSANPLARRHERLAIEPFYDSVSAAKTSRIAAASEVSEEEAEAASWLLPDPNNKLNEEPASPEYKSSAYLFSDMDPEADPDPYLDLGLLSREQKAAGSEQKQYSSDGVVPVQTENEYGQGQCPGPVVDGFPAYDVDNPGSKPFMYDFTSSSQPLSQSVSCSSLEVGVVPEMAEGVPVRVCGMEREARVLRYREKRKNRRFEKTIRYASRKAYAETRPRIKGRFARRSS